MLNVSHVPEQSAALRGVRQDLNLLLKLKTPPLPEGQERPPLRLACVVDRSGSMAGAKLRNAKRAVRKVVKHFSPRDTLHFLVYDNETQVVFEDGNLEEPEKLTQMIKSVRVGGATNISGALEAAAELLLKGDEPQGGEEPAPTSAATSPQVREIRRVFLFSDGQPNGGISDAQGLGQLAARYVERGVTFSAFGIGTDFSSEVMTAIAQKGRGDFFFISDGKSIPKVVSKSLRGLLATAVCQATLLCQGLNGCLALKVPGHEGADLTSGVLLGDLAWNEERNVLVSVQVVPPLSPQQTEMDILSYTIKFQKPQQQQQQQEGEGNAETVDTESSVSGTVPLPFVDTREALPPPNTEVRVASAILRASELDEEAQDLLEDAEEGRGSNRQTLLTSAVSKKEASIALLRDVLALDTSARVSRLLEKAEPLLQEMRDALAQGPDAESSALRAIAFEMQYRNQRGRRMRASSDCSDDSDDGMYSVSSGGGGGGGANSPPGSPRANLRSRMGSLFSHIIGRGQPARAGSGSGSDGEDDDDDDSDSPFTPRSPRYFPTGDDDEWMGGGGPRETAEPETEPQETERENPQTTAGVSEGPVTLPFPSQIPVVASGSNSAALPPASSSSSSSAPPAPSAPDHQHDMEVAEEGVPLAPYDNDVMRPAKKSKAEDETQE